MAVALGLGTVAIGAFVDDKVAEIVAENKYETPVYIMPIGKPAEIPRTSFEDIEKYILSKRRKM